MLRLLVLDSGRRPSMTIRTDPSKSRGGTPPRGVDNTASSALVDGDVSQRRRSRGFCMAATFFGFFGLLVLSWMILFRGQRTAYLMDNLGQFFSGLVAMTTCAVAARRHRQRWTGWALLAASLGIVVCGNGIWCYYHLIFAWGHRDPHRSLTSPLR